jgi:RNA polymerase sigma-70 factor (ECF subfamily)
MGIHAATLEWRWWEHIWAGVRRWLAAFAPDAVSSIAMDPVRVERLVTAGMAAWPDVRVDAQAFAAFVQGKQLETEEHVADLYLAYGCSQGEPHAITAFESRLLSQVPGYIARVSREPAFVQEVQQQLRDRLLVRTQVQAPKIAEYAGKGPLGGWLRVVAIRAGLELKRGVRNDHDVDDESSGRMMASPDPELQYVRVRYAGQFKQAFSQAMGDLESRQRTILKLYLVDGLNIDRIGKLYDVHRATVARWIQTARDSLYDGTRAQLQAQLNLSREEFESLLGVVRSDLDVSVCRLLGDEPGKG